MTEYIIKITSPAILKYIKIARPDHWVKNIFVIPGIVIAALLTKTSLHTDHVFAIIIGLFATCFISSANYIINEWLDAEFDLFHPIKKNRALVGEDVNSKIIIFEYILLVAAGLTLSLKVSTVFLIIEIWLLVMGIFYNVKPMRTKDVPYLDVLTESVNNAIRLLLGWFMVTSVWLPPASLILGYWMGGAYLMAVKRYAEYRMINDPHVAGNYRKSFQRYTEVTLLSSSVFYALISVFFTGVFLIKYRIELILAMPFLCGLYCLYIQISYKEDSAVQKPEKLYKERGLMLYIVFLIVLFAFLMFVDIPWLSLLLEGNLLPFISGSV